MPATSWRRRLAHRAANQQAAAAQAAAAIAAMVAHPEWGDVFTAYARCARITRSLSERGTLNPASVCGGRRGRTAGGVRSCGGGHGAGKGTGRGPVAGAEGAQRANQRLFFAKVLVNAEDESLRKARLALVQQIALLPAGVGGSEQAAGVLEEACPGPATASGHLQVPGTVARAVRARLAPPGCRLAR